MTSSKYVMVDFMMLLFSLYICIIKSYKKSLVFAKLFQIVICCLFFTSHQKRLHSTASFFIWLSMVVCISYAKIPKTKKVVFSYSLKYVVSMVYIYAPVHTQTDTRKRKQKDGE